MHDERVKQGALTKEYVIMTNRYVTSMVVVLLTAVITPLCWAQSNSLFLAAEQVGPAAPEPLQSWPVAKVPIIYGMLTEKNVPFEMASFTAVQLPPPRVFKLHDLVTVIIRETKSFTGTQD